jgi:hypothetical protein
VLSATMWYPLQSSHSANKTESLPVGSCALQTRTAVSSKNVLCCFGTFFCKGSFPQGMHFHWMCMPQNEHSPSQTMVPHLGTMDDTGTMAREIYIEHKEHVVRNVTTPSRKVLS